MSFNKLERKALKQIEVNEGLLSKLAKLFLGSDFQKTMRELERMKKEDPELEAGMASFKQNYDIIKRIHTRVSNDLNSKK